MVDVKAHYAALMCSQAPTNADSTCAAVTQSKEVYHSVAQAQKFVQACGVYMDADRIPWNVPLDKDLVTPYVDEYLVAPRLKLTKTPNDKNFHVARLSSLQYTAALFATRASSWVNTQAHNAFGSFEAELRELALLTYAPILVDAGCSGHDCIKQVESIAQRFLSGGSLMCVDPANNGISVRCNNLFTDALSSALKISYDTTTILTADLPNSTACWNMVNDYLRSIKASIATEMAFIQKNWPDAIAEIQVQPQATPAPAAPVVAPATQAPVAAPVTAVPVAAPAASATTPAAAEVVEEPIVPVPVKTKIKPVVHRPRYIPVEVDDGDEGDAAEAAPAPRQAPPPPKPAAPKQPSSGFGSDF